MANRMSFDTVISGVSIASQINSLSPNGPPQTRPKPKKADEPKPPQANQMKSLREAQDLLDLSDEIFGISEESELPTIAEVGGTSFRFIDEDEETIIDGDDRENVVPFSEKKPDPPATPTLSKRESFLLATRESFLGKLPGMGAGEKKEPENEVRHEFNVDNAKAADQNVMEKQTVVNNYELLVANRPFTCLAIYFIVLLIMSIIDVIYFEFSDISQRMYMLSGKEDVQLWDAWLLARRQAGLSNGEPQSEEVSAWALLAMYKTEDESGIFTPERSESIHEVSNRVRNVNGWLKLCLEKPNLPKCAEALYGCSELLLNKTQEEIDYFLQSNHSLRCRGLFPQEWEPGENPRFYREIFSFGLPYPDVSGNISSFSNADDRYEEQRENYDKWIAKAYREIQFESDIPRVDVLCAGQRAIELEIIRLYTEEFYWITFSAGAVFFYMWFHLQSLFLAFCGMFFEIGMSFPLGFFIFRFITQVTFFDTTLTLAIFIVLGIGADDLFVFMDQWVQSVNYIHRYKITEDILAHRLAYALRHSARAIFVTSFTTFCAFMATVPSPIMTISAFGLWGAWMVIADFFLAITAFPCCVIIWEKHVRPHEYWFCFDKKETDTHTEEHVSRYNIRSRKLEIFLTEYVAWFAYKFRKPIIVIFLGILGFAAYFALQLSPLTEQEQFFPADHYVQRAFDLSQEFYTANGDDVVVVQYTWGFTGIDRKGTSKWDFMDWGKVVWDDGFDPSSPEAQLHLVHACNVMGQMPKVQSTNCFIKDYRDYMAQKGVTFPIVFSNDTTTQSIKFAESLYEYASERTNDAGVKAKNFGFVDNGVRYVSLGATLAVRNYEQRDTYDPMFDEWQSLMKDLNEIAVPELSKGQNTAFAWAWRWTETGYAISAINGISIALPLAFASLLVSTWNWSMAVMATVSITGVMSCTSATIVLLGWNLGVPESLAIIITIGLSVDFVVHLANEYIHVPTMNRKIRVTNSLYRMGISVLSGSFSTFLSGAFLIPAKARLYFKFGILIVCTVIYSTLWALLFFMAVLSQMGPKKGLGSSLDRMFNVCGPDACNLLRRHKKKFDKHRESIKAFEHAKLGRNFMQEMADLQKQETQESSDSEHGYIQPDGVVEYDVSKIENIVFEEAQKPDPGDLIKKASPTRVARGGTNSPFFKPRTTPVISPKASPLFSPRNVFKLTPKTMQELPPSPLANRLQNSKNPWEQAYPRANRYSPRNSIIAPSPPGSRKSDRTTPTRIPQLPASPRSKNLARASVSIDTSPRIRSQEKPRLVQSASPIPKFKPGSLSPNAKRKPMHNAYYDTRKEYSPRSPITNRITSEERNSILALTNTKRRPTHQGLTE